MFSIVMQLICDGVQSFLSYRFKKVRVRGSGMGLRNRGTFVKFCEDSTKAAPDAGSTWLND